MTNDDSALREVDQAMAEDRQWELFEKNGPILIAGAAAIVLAVGGWQLWKARQAAGSEKAAVEYATATQTIETARADGLTALGDLSENGPPGYSILSDMRRAAGLAADGDSSGALAAYRGVYGQSSAPKHIRELARLRAAMLSLSNGREEVLNDLGSLQESDSRFRYYAQELNALAALKAKDYETAFEMFQSAVGNPETPEPVRVRAQEFAALSAAGKDGVNLTSEASVDDLLDALGPEETGKDEALAGDDINEMHDVIGEQDDAGVTDVNPSGAQEGRQEPEPESDEPEQER